MKFRTDFVTNSSSSGFIVWTIKNKELAKLFEECGFESTDDTVHDRLFGESTGYGPIEAGNSLSDWLIELFNDSSFTLGQKDVYRELSQKIAEEAEKIDAATEYLEIHIADIVSDGEGSRYSLEIWKDGETTTTWLDEGSWDFEKEGQPLYEFLSSNLETIRKKAEQINGIAINEDSLHEDSSIEEVVEKNEESREEDFVISKRVVKDYKGKAPVIRIPLEVYTIGPSTFYGSKTIEKLILSRDVKKIGQEAFCECKKLTQVIFEENGHLARIDKFAFDECNSLKSLIIPKTVTLIEKGIVNNCNSLTELAVDKDNPTFDSRNDCNAIIETATDTLISGCNVTVIPNGIKRIGELAFRGCENLEELVIPESVVEIGEMAFNACTSMRRVVIPGAVNLIGSLAFNECYNLEELIVDKGNPIYDSRNDCNAIIETATDTLISGCSTTVIPYGVQTIGASAFLDCKNLKEIEIPESVSKIEFHAFGECKSLKKIKIPASVKEIGGDAFKGCTSLKEVELSEGLEKISSEAFDKCRALKKIVIPESVKWISDYTPFPRTTMIMAPRDSYAIYFAKNNKYSYQEI